MGLHQGQELLLLCDFKWMITLCHKVYGIPEVSAVYIWEMKKKETHESFAKIWIYLIIASHSCFLFFPLQLVHRYNLFVLLRKLTTFSFHNYNILVCCTEHTDVVQRVNPDKFAIYLVTHLQTSKWTPMYFPPEEAFRMRGWNVFEKVEQALRFNYCGR